jgi:hypothetical protein
VEDRIGWLLGTNGTSVLRFRSFENPEFYGEWLTEIITAQLIPNEHPLLKSKRVIKRKQALVEWKNLIIEGWKPVKAQW